MWYEVRIEAKAYCTERTFASTPEEAAAKAIVQADNGYHFWEAAESWQNGTSCLVILMTMALIRMNNINTAPKTAGVQRNFSHHSLSARA